LDGVAKLGIPDGPQPRIPERFGPAMERRHILGCRLGHRQTVPHGVQVFQRTVPRYAGNRVRLQKAPQAHSPSWLDPA
jgi:hypothetical protein